MVYHINPINYYYPALAGDHNRVHTKVQRLTNVYANNTRCPKGEIAAYFAIVHAGGKAFVKNSFAVGIFSSDVAYIRS